MQDIQLNLEAENYRVNNGSISGMEAKWRIEIFNFLTN
jgi:hypothetical protein